MSAIVRLGGFNKAVKYLMDVTLNRIAKPNPILFF